MENTEHRLKQRRRELGLTQGRLAKLSGVAQGTISRIEKGETLYPDPPTARALAKALQTTPEVLFGDPISSTRILAPPSSPSSNMPPSVDMQQDTAFEQAIGHAFDSTRHTLRDVDAIRRVFHDTAQTEGAGADLVAMARLWLDMAALARQRGVPVTTETLLVEITRQKLETKRAG